MKKIETEIIQERQTKNNHVDLNFRHPGKQKLKKTVISVNKVSHSPGVAR